MYEMYAHFTIHNPGNPVIFLACKIADIISSCATGKDSIINSLQRNDKFFNLVQFIPNIGGRLPFGGWIKARTPFPLICPRGYSV